MVPFADFFESRRRHTRRHSAGDGAKRRGRKSALLGGAESLERRQLLSVTVIGPIGDQAVPAHADGTAEIQLSDRFALPDVAGTVVKVETNAPRANPHFFVELFDTGASAPVRTTPATAGNFLAYVDDDSLDRSIVHRSVPGFVIQGGGFKAPVSSVGPTTISTKGTVIDEVGNPNQRGTIAMAKVAPSAGPPLANSATSQWFVNLDDNASLDPDFTAFGRVLGNGMSVVDAMAAATTYNASTYFGNSALTNLPLWSVPNDGAIREENFVTIASASRADRASLLSYSVTSSDPGLVRPQLAGGSLVLTRAGSRSGTATITVRATAAFDVTDFVDSSFTVVVPQATASIIEATGSTALGVDAAGRLTVNGVQVLSFGNPVDFYGMTAAGWRPIAAEKVGGTNTIVWRNTSGSLHFWRLSSTWQHLSSDGQHAPGSAGYLAAETSFATDFNGDGDVGIRTVLDSRGAVTLSHDSPGTLRANGVQIISFGSPVNHNAYVGWGWTAVAAENVGGTNTIVWRNTSGSLHFWRLSSSWQHLSSDGMHAPGSAEYYAAETSFATDFNGDTFVGAPDTIIERVGFTALAYTNSGTLVVNRVPVTSGGNPVNFHSYARIGYTAVGAEAVNGVNSIAWRMPDKKLHFWRLSSDWAQVSSDSMMVPGAPRYHAAEVAFGRDFDDDGVIGSPFTIIEAVGAVRLSYDRAGNLFANGTAITAGGVPVNYQSYANIGYTARAVETVDGVNTLAWVTTDSKIHYWRLSSSWAQTSSDSMIVPGRPRYLAAETTFGVDFDGNGRIGS